jgi:ABC-type phosphate/phosphonate transport system substrate-binding protein
MKASLTTLLANHLLEIGPFLPRNPESHALLIGTNASQTVPELMRRGTRKDLQSLADLKGKLFMAVTEHSLGGWLAAWRELKDSGLDPKRNLAGLRFAGTDDEVVTAVLQGKADAGTVRTGFLEAMVAEGRLRMLDIQVLRPPELRNDETPLPFISSTRLYPQEPLAALHHVPRGLVAQVALHLLQMPARDGAARAAGYVKMTD